MARIKFLTGIAGTTKDGFPFSHKPGDVVNWSDEAEAQRFLAAGYAETAEGKKGDEAPAAKRGKETAEGKKGTEKTGG